MVHNWENCTMSICGAKELACSFTILNHNGLFCVSPEGKAIDKERIVDFVQKKRDIFHLEVGRRWFDLWTSLAGYLAVTMSPGADFCVMYRGRGGVLIIQPVWHGYVHVFRDEAVELLVCNRGISLNFSYCNGNTVYYQARVWHHQRCPEAWKLSLCSCACACTWERLCVCVCVSVCARACTCVHVIITSTTN